MARIVNIDYNHPDEAENTFAEIRARLASGGVIAFPTDTFYGLGADPMNPKAVGRIYAIKNRPVHKPVLVLITSLKQLDDFAAEISPEAKKLIRAFWPGPLTLLFKAKPHLPQNLTAGSGKIGIRLPANAFTLELIRRIGHPLTAPSANPSGSGNLSDAKKVMQALGDKVDLIIDGGQTHETAASTVLDITVHPPKLLREGGVTLAQIENILNKTTTTTNNG